MGRGASTHLTSFSFRAFRFATRYLGDCRGLYYRVDEGVFPYNGGDGFRHPRRGRCPHRPVPPAPIDHQASGSEKRSNSMRRPPRRPGHHPARDGSIDLAEDPSVPEGQAKSEQAPIRRPPSRAEGHCTGARTSAFFSSTGRGAFSFWARPKREWGAHPPWKRPPAGAESPVANLRRPAFSLPPKAGGLLRSASPHPAPADSASIP